jgi:putative transposase
MHFLKLSFVKRLRTLSYKVDLGPFWQKRYYDRNVRNSFEFAAKLDYMHSNPVKRRLVLQPGDWQWSSFRHYAFREVGVVEIETE